MAGWSGRLVAAAILWWLAAAQAHAADAVAGVARFSGAQGTLVRDAVVEALRAGGLRVVSLDELERTATVLRVSPERPAGIRALAARLGLTTVITGQVVGQGTVRAARIAVHAVETGDVAAESTFIASSGPALVSAVRAELWQRLAAALSARAQPPAALAPEPVAPPSPSPSPSRPPPSPPPIVASAPPAAHGAPPASTGLPALEIAFGPRLLLRRLTFKSDPDGKLTRFESGPTLALALDADWFPRLIWPRLGVAGRLEFGVPDRTRSGSDLLYRLPSSDVVGAALVGWPFRRGSLDLALGGGWQRFAVVPVGEATSHPRPVPDVSYGYLRIGLAARLYPIDRLWLRGAVFYRHLLGTGEIASGDWFPSLRARGTEAALGGGYRFTRSIEARVEGDMRLYRFGVYPDPKAGHVTTGGGDLYWGISVAVAILLGARP